MIPYTKPFLPPREEFDHYLEGIWQRNWLTNNGPLVNELELQLKTLLNLPHLLFVGNGTLAIQIAIKALDLKGEIITTPFSYVATTSAVAWEGLTPVFVDIDPQTLNINPARIEAAITPQTSAILATHVYGNPCDIPAIQKIADKHGLKVIYDGAHCFGTQYRGRSVFAYGDICITSFHATKLFHTVEGGAVFTQSPELLRKMALLRNFGHTGTNSFEGVGINAKNSEFHAAMGLINLKHIEQIMDVRQRQWLRYREMLTDFQVGGISIKKDARFNFAYYPVIFSSEDELLKYTEVLQIHSIFARRYFYPSLNLLDYTGRQACPHSESISKRILCLPLYHDMSEEVQNLIIRVLLRTQNN